MTCSSKRLYAVSCVGGPRKVRWCHTVCHNYLAEVDILEKWKFPRVSVGLGSALHRTSNQRFLMMFLGCCDHSSSVSTWRVLELPSRHSSGTCVRLFPEMTGWGGRDQQMWTAALSTDWGPRTNPMETGAGQQLSFLSTSWLQIRHYHLAFPTLMASTPIKPSFLKLLLCILSQPREQCSDVNGIVYSVLPR